MVPAEIWFSSLLVLLLIGLAARGWRAVALDRRWRRPLGGVPAELGELWSHDDPRGSRDAGEDDNQAPALSAIDVLFHLSRLDRRQLARFRPEKPPSNFEELLRQFRAPSEAAPTRGPGLGEELLAQQLSHAGHDVLLEPASEPEVADAPGWMARVDGTRVRLVASPDAAVIRQCLQQSPTVAVVTVAEQAETFAGKANVVALPEVTHAQINRDLTGPRPPGHGDSAALDRVDEQVRAEDPTLASLKDIGSLLASQAISPKLAATLRTAQLIAKGDAAWLSSATDGLVDSAASSAGGWAGARAGAMLGALLGPVGVAAGGFLGGLLGKQLAASVAAGSREKKLRALLAEQEALMAKVPQAALNSLTAQAQHLQTVTKELGSGLPTFEPWPAAETRARRQLVAEYRRWQQRVERRARQLRAFTQTRPSKSKQRAKGATLLANGRLGWSPELLGLRAQLVELTARIEAERRKLGQA